MLRMSAFFRGQSRRMSDDPLYISTEGIQPYVNLLISPVDLINIMNSAGAFSRKGRDEQGYTGTNIR